jgi:tRNA-dihydrouridine synthase
MREAAKLCAEMGFDGIDINMGCPDRSIEKQGAGAAMIKTPDIASQIIQSVKDGIRDAGKDIPVSVKTRVGYNKVQIEEWIPFLLSQDISALTIHCRTRKEMSLVPAHWEYVKEVVTIRDRMGVKTKIIGNGDVRSVAHGHALAQETRCDGVMIGRAIFGNPWLFANSAGTQHPSTIEHPVSFFSKIKRIFSKDKDAHKYWLHQESTIPISERLRVLVEHTKLFEELLGDGLSQQKLVDRTGKPVLGKSFSIMKKHFKAYVNGFDGAKELRIKLMEAGNAEEVEDRIHEFLG